MKTTTTSISSYQIKILNSFKVKSRQTQIRIYNHCHCCLIRECNFHHVLHCAYQNSTWSSYSNDIFNQLTRTMTSMLHIQNHDSLSYFRESQQSLQRQLTCWFFIIHWVCVRTRRCSEDERSKSQSNFKSRNSRV